MKEGRNGEKDLSQNTRRTTQPVRGTLATVGYMTCGEWEWHDS